MKLLTALIFSLLCLPASAQQYPGKPVRIIVPFAPGGGSDFIARFMAQRLTDSLGAQVIVENKPGAGGMLGVEQGVKAAVVMKLAPDAKLDGKSPEYVAARYDAELERVAAGPAPIDNARGFTGNPAPRADGKTAKQIHDEREQGFHKVPK